jgi:hypothetical protein
MPLADPPSELLADRPRPLGPGAARRSVPGYGRLKRKIGAFTLGRPSDSTVDAGFARHHEGPVAAMSD